MTRMTSDIEQLQQLLQDGLAQLVVQALTMIVITIILFTLNVELALITLALVIPLLTSASLWFRKASAVAYNRVRDGIANVLGDLSESSTASARLPLQPPALEHRPARNVVGDYRDANNYTAQINALYVRAPRCSATSARRHCWPSAGTWSSTTSCRSVRWSPSSCI